MKRNIKKIALAIAIAGAIMNPATAMANQTQPAKQEREIFVYLDGKKLAFDQPPALIDGRTLVPMRAIFEALGTEVTWYGDTQSIMATRVTETTVLKCDISIPQNSIMIMYTEYDPATMKEQYPKQTYGVTFQTFFEVPPQIINGRTLVPARAIAEAFGAKVTWNGDLKTVYIETAGAKITEPDGWREEAAKRNVNTTPTVITEAPNPTTEQPQKQEAETQPQKAKPLTEPPEVGVTLGNILKDINDPITTGSSKYTEPYASYSIGECTWYAAGRFYEVHGIRIAAYDYKLGSIKEWPQNANNYDNLLGITDPKDIREQSIAAFENIANPNHPGHVVFIEYVERDAQGNPINVYYTEANGAYDLNKSKYDYGYDGIVIKVTYEQFISPYQMELVGYIVPR